MAGTFLPSSLLSQGPSLLLSTPNQVSDVICRIVITSGKRCVPCFAKKKISFADQILDYIEGGPKLRKWYGAPELMPKDGSMSRDDDTVEADEEEEEDDSDKEAVFVTDGDSDLGQMIILQLIVKGTRIKALVKDKRKALDAFGSYVELTSGDSSDERFLRKAFRGVGAVISPTEGFFSNVNKLKGVKHAVLLSQLSVYESSGGFQAMMNNKAKKLAEQDENTIRSSSVPYTIIRAGKLENSPGGIQGFSFSPGTAGKGSISKEDAARICVEAISVIPPTGLIFEVANGEGAVSDWEGQFMKLMQRQSEYK